MDNLTGYDVIGDVHGHLDALTRLLQQMGYRETNGGFSHPDRKAVFVGDLVDRGSHGVGVVELVRHMVTAGHASIVMGNHEFNAIAYATVDPDRPGEHLRPHIEKNDKQHVEFMKEVGFGSQLHQEIVEWFRTIPLWLELELEGRRLRVIHACWHSESMAALQPLLAPDLAMTDTALIEGCRKGTAQFDAIETLLKGPEVSMGGRTYFDKDGNPRSNARVAWWRSSARSLRDVALIPENAKSADGSSLSPLPDSPIDMSHLVYTDPVPVLFGHYWHTGEPAVLTPTTACVDFSVAKGGPLVAYRWSGEETLRNEHFVATG